MKAEQLVIFASKIGTVNMFMDKAAKVVGSAEGRSVYIKNVSIHKSIVRVFIKK
jgi:hypothetical protein